MEDEIIIIGKIAIIEGLSPWVLNRVRPVVDLVKMADELKEQLKALPTQE